MQIFAPLVFFLIPGMHDSSAGTVLGLTLSGQYCRQRIVLSHNGSSSFGTHTLQCFVPSRHSVSRENG